MLQKTNLNINFAKGLDTKTDPWQVQPGNFLSLENSIFTKAGLLQKRNGFSSLPSLPDATSTYLTTFGGGLTALGTSLNAYSSDADEWVQKTNITPLSLSVDSVVRNTYNQSYADSAVASNGLICTVYTEFTGSVTQYRYIIQDGSTGQTIVNPTAIVGTGTTTYAPRVFYLDPYFIVMFDDLVSSTNFLKYIAIPAMNPTVPKPVGQISALYSPASTGTFDAVVFSNNLYVFWNSTSTTIKGTYLTPQLTSPAAVSFASQNATNVSVCLDATKSVIYCDWIAPSSGNIYAAGVSSTLAVVLAPTLVVSSSAAINITSTAINGVLTVFYEVTNTYLGGLPCDYISSNTCSQTGTVGTPAVVVRSVGLASKAFLYNGISYFLAIYNSTYQATYFLINSLGKVVAKLAYENGPSAYYLTGLPTVNLSGSVAQFPYLYKDQIDSLAVNNTTGATQSGNIYSQTGVNICTIEFGTQDLDTAEIGSNLNISGGFVGMYDGVRFVEQNFFLFPDNPTVTTATTGGNITAQQYYYQFTYEWADNKGNAFRSAPSIPITITTTGSTSVNTLTVPTLRLTYKNNLKICGYRWSAANETYYQFTSITVPTLNNPAVDTVTIVDTLADSSIVGNNILYTTGGVVEDVAPPATNLFTLFNDRLWLVDAEDTNLLWYSKQVIEATPVEMSDLFTIYVAPTTGAQGSTGPITALSAMDDKLIIFKESAIYYINGIGPDNTGANSQYTDPIFISSTVGCANQNSIVFTPNGLMFQSDKGIWLLGRDLSSQYIGASVEEFNSNEVLSAVNIPTENQVRFTLDNGVTLMYDYYYGQWGTFVGVPAISSTVFEGLHTFINNLGQVRQESPGVYLDGSSPVLMGFTTSWFNLAGLQGYQRLFFFYLIGQYISPHKLSVGIAYDYNPSLEQLNLITPVNFSPAYGSPSSNGQQTVYGQNTPYGGPGNVEQWRTFPQHQRCKSFQIVLQEVYDPSMGVSAGEGLSISGLNLVVSVKKGWNPISATNSVGV